mmetsp:Transcript_40556/g.95231  ORF Transcript_40556/g.95231 Transcript_40556/m.95231 type:complete len:154 (-) Transcript_40556:538-999(-)|eukprot:CAMPEP_0113310078 /NCGR_PEP_ID=MMETSP0010_2-20120614/7865_1 /TAXON_ID=216773 ORGANISM="Corethron hystrix, Strain 308" /NCGR_SAMPLE_ID=MMETSP0010_2 /ASSEMBLY_ACC=CAM_ASM_000155 /LENGTH=153 /DNA_ID=CAMNT_0000165457 /DNA_START=124 /DNA_END=585 /DNA_ORIENTATION=- /assembly_acc=CAM_ASM_000155
MPSNSDIIKLQSKDGDEFELTFKAARLSKYIEDEIDSKGTDEPIKLEKVNTPSLRKVVDYLKHYETEKMKKIVMPLKKFEISENVQKWYAAFVEEMEEDMLFEMINIANDLKCMQLMTLCTAHTACLMKKVPMETIQDIMHMMKGSNLQSEDK